MTSLQSTGQVAICAGGIRNGDAVGIDVISMAEVLTQLGYRVTLVAFSTEDIIRQQFDFIDLSTLTTLNDFDMVIYHHCILLPEIEPLLNSYNGRLILRYHNITPAEFFEPYPAAARAVQMCAQGRQQTKRLLERFADRGWWMPASHYNVQDLEYTLPGVTLRHVTVVPPFNRLEQFRASMPPRIEVATDVPELLFVGRFSPNKNHLDMVRAVYAYTRLFDNDIHLTMVGSQDPALSVYMQQLEQLISELGLEQQVSILSHVPEEQLKQLYASATAFFCMSQHEGFCVPVVEAQALGLPVLTTTTAAIGETLGPDQFGFDRPQSATDFIYVAKLIDLATRNSDVRHQLIQQGYRNIAGRFSGEVIAEKFIEGIFDVQKAAEVGL